MVSSGVGGVRCAGGAWWCCVGGAGGAGESRCWCWWVGGCYGEEEVMVLAVLPLLLNSVSSGICEVRVNTSLSLSYNSNVATILSPGPQPLYLHFFYMINISTFLTTFEFKELRRSYLQHHCLRFQSRYHLCPSIRS